ncbi:MAG: NAD-dependent epimerase/dehydratase family protein, partial [Rhodoferax sp.]|nr:NAD-dependent epimerase/dehydratase family protein [Rhodoferax sp.]
MASLTDQAADEDLLTRVKGRGPATSGLRVLCLGATGTIGRAAVAALVAAGHHVVCVVRPGRTAAAPAPGDRCCDDPAGPQWRVAEVADPASLQRQGIRGEVFDALVSCMASRSGTPEDAWAVDHDAHCVALEVARASGIRHFVLLSAICVQKPRLAFQHAKLAFERKLMESGLRYSIVRPTAFFKSLSGQVARVARGRSFLVFGDGRLTACKPIGDQDLGLY